MELRCREAEWLDRPETLVEFSESPNSPGRTPKTVAQRYAGLSEILVTDAIARSHLEVRSLMGDRMVFTCETPRFGIPLGVMDLERPPIEEWQLRSHVDGDLIDIDRAGRVEHSLAMQVRRGLLAVAGALPLLLTPTFAHAGALAGDGLLRDASSLEQLATFGPPKLPETTPSAPPPVEQPTTAPPVVEPTPTPTPPSVVAPPAPRVQAESLSLTGTTLWEGLLGKQVRLEMKGGQAVTGIVIAQTSSDLAIARTPDGTVVAVPKNEVAGVRLRMEAATAGGSNVGNRPTENGRGTLAGGVVMVTIGSIAGLAGTVMLGISPSAVYISLPLLLPGLAMIGGGSAMISAGSKKRKAYNQAWGLPPTSKLQMTPTFAGGRNGGNVGLVLRF